MSLIIGTGSNLGDKKANLNLAKEKLSAFLTLEAQSQIYSSDAVDYENQPSFFNQVLEFSIPQNLAPKELMSKLLQIELDMGRERDIPKGPRIIDLDILFWGEYKSFNTQLTIPHPRLFERSFVIKPLSELPYYSTLKTRYQFPQDFSTDAHIV